MARNDPYPLIPQGRHHEQQTPFNHADRDDSRLARILTVIMQFERKDVGEYAASRLETYTMLPQVRGSLAIIPFDCIRPNNYWLPADRSSSRRIAYPRRANIEQQAAQLLR